MGLEHPTFHLRGEDVSTSPPPLPKRCCLIHCNSLPLIRIFIPQLFYSGGLKKEHKIKIAPQIQSRGKSKIHPYANERCVSQLWTKLLRKMSIELRSFGKKSSYSTSNIYYFHQPFTSPTTSSFYQCDFTF